MPTHVNDLTGLIIGAAIEVHRNLGPGLLESAYHKCLARELEIHGIAFKYKWPFPREYKGIRLEKGYEIDRRKIVLRDAIKETGEYTAKVKLHRDVTLEIPVTVTAEGGDEAAAAKAEKKGRKPKAEAVVDEPAAAE